MRGLGCTWRDRRGAVGLEFALVTPVLIVVVMSLSDVTGAVIAWWRLSAAAATIARIATTFAATPDNTNVLTLKQAATASTAVFAVMPALATTPSTYGVAISSVVMTPTVPGCTSNCTYVANTAWSAALQGTPQIRPCGQLSAVPDGQPSTPTTLPLDAFTPASVLVVDVTYDFTPLFTNVFGGGLQFTETAYMAPRTGGVSAWTRITGPNAAATQCPGYTG